MCAESKQARCKHCCKATSGCSASVTTRQSVRLSVEARLTFSSTGQPQVNQTWPSPAASAAQAETFPFYEMPFTNESTSPNQWLMSSHKYILSQASGMNRSAPCYKGREPLLQIQSALQSWRKPALVNLLSSTCALQCPASGHNLTILSCIEVLSPPVCQKRQHQLPGPSGTNDTREDPFYWLRDDDRKDEDVLAHLRV